MDIYELLDFASIREAIKAFTKTEIGALFATQIQCFDNQETLNVALKELDEAHVLLLKHGVLPLSQSHNLEPILNYGRQGNILTPHDFYLISADIANLVKILDYLKDKITKAPLLTAKLRNVFDLKSLKNNIEKIIAPNLTIKNNASPELARIRKTISATEDRISKTSGSIVAKYSSYLVENLVTQRDGHYVIPIKANFKSKVDGIIYDISNSGQTLFIEPSEMAQLNNALISIKNDEIIEINRLLRGLTNEVMMESHHILANNLLLGEIDFLFAKASYGEKIKAMIPEFTNQRGLSFTNARHPLIDPSLVVANSFHLHDERYIIIISGPNAGGKTVALKTMGLFVLMAKSGLMLPVSATPTLSFYSNVYASIGDEQSLSHNLSTFSSHVKRVGEILKVATSNDLVLLDELATGTSPEEGEALALAITKHLLEKNISAVISSHYSRLKEFAYQSKEIINASMAFDEQGLQPLYIYHEEVPGRSYGLVVARRFGIPSPIIKDALSYLSSGVYDFEKTIGKLRYELTLVQKEKDTFAQERSLLAARQKELDSELAKMKAELVKFKTEKDENLKTELLETRQQLDELVKQALNSQNAAHKVIDIRRQLDDLTMNEQEVDEDDDDETLEVGDTVLIKSLNVLGKIEAIKIDVFTITLRSGKTMKVARNNLAKSYETLKKETKAVVITDSFKTNESVKTELNVIGMRVDEAISVIGPYLDKAILKRFPSVRIIHGFGTGALRRGIHEYLATIPYVKSFTLAGQFEGQGGATVVTFK